MVTPMTTPMTSICLKSHGHSHAGVAGIRHCWGDLHPAMDEYSLMMMMMTMTGIGTMTMTMTGMGMMTMTMTMATTTTVGDDGHCNACRKER